MVIAKRIIDGKNVFVAGPVLFDEYGNIPIWTDIEIGEEYKESELIFP